MVARAPSEEGFPQGGSDGNFVVGGIGFEGAHERHLELVAEIFIPDRHFGTQMGSRLMLGAFDHFRKLNRLLQIGEAGFHALLIQLGLVVGRVFAQVSMRLRLSDRFRDAGADRPLQLIELGLQFCEALGRHLILIRHEPNIVASGATSVASNVSVVIVSFNTRDKLRRCLAQIEPEHEMIVVDNASADGSVEMVRAEFPEARLISNSENRGFGAANNQGMAVATGELVLFLNSDCYAEPGAIGRLAEVFDGRPEVAAAGGRLLNPDGSNQESVAGELTLFAVLLEQLHLDRFGGRFRYWRTSFAREGEPVAQVMGACLMIRPVECFDERFFLYCEDTDLCRRLARHGSIMFVPAARFTHELGSSSEGEERWRSVARYNRGKELYFAIHHGRLAAATCWVLDRFGAALRLLVYLVATLGAVAGPRLRLWTRVLCAPILGPDRR